MVNTTFGKFSFTISQFPVLTELPMYYLKILRIRSSCKTIFHRKSSYYSLTVKTYTMGNASGSSSHVEANSKCDADSNDQYLKPHGLIDSNDNTIVTKANELTKECTNDQEKLVKIHKFMHENILFGFPSAFDNIKASQVLSLGYGFCNPQSTLFVALCRAAGLPARQHFVSIDRNILKGFFGLQTQFVDHCYSEVFVQKAKQENDESKENTVWLFFLFLILLLFLQSVHHAREMLYMNA